MHRKQREHVGAYGIEGDITEIEQAREPDHDVQSPAEHHVGEDEDRQVEQVAQRQSGMERLLDEIGAYGKQHGEQDPADGEDAGIRKIGEEKDYGAPQRADEEEAEHERADQHEDRRARDAPDDEDECRRARRGAQDDQIAPVEALAGEELGEGRGDGILGMPDEQAEQEPPRHDDADGDREQHRPRLERETGDAIDRALAEQERKQQKGDDAADKRVADGRLEPLTEGFAGLSQGAQTFSTSGRPSSPVGKKMRTMASIENAATSLYSMVK